MIMDCLRTWFDRAHFPVCCTAGYTRRKGDFSMTLFVDIYVWWMVLLHAQHMHSLMCCVVYRKTHDHHYLFDQSIRFVASVYTCIFASQCTSTRMIQIKLNNKFSSEFHIFVRVELLCGQHFGYISNPQFCSQRIMYENNATDRHAQTKHKDTGGGVPSAAENISFNFYCPFFVLSSHHNFSEFVPTIGVYYDFMDAND